MKTISGVQKICNLETSELLRCGKVHSFQTIKDINSTNWRLECRSCQNFTFLYFIISEKEDVKESGSWRPRSRTSRLDRVGSVHDRNRFYVQKEKNGIYKTVLRPFLRILAYSFDFPYYVRRNSLTRFSRNEYAHSFFGEDFQPDALYLFYIHILAILALCILHTKNILNENKGKKIWNKQIVE